MSRVHDALRKAAQERSSEAPKISRKTEAFMRVAGNIPAVSAPVYQPPSAPEPAEPSLDARPSAALQAEDLENLEEAISGAREFPYRPLNEALLVDVSNPREAPAEEFRSLRTRLNHLQTLQPLRALVVTSASPAEGKSFTAMNLAVAQAQLADKRVLLADFDFRRPFVDKAFQIDMSPGITDYLQGNARIGEILRRIAGTNLYLMTGGSAVPNPLELLNLKECRALIDALRAHFDWVIMDSPPLLFAADGNLLSTMCDGTILVVRIGATTVDAVARAMQSLCENNVLGIVVNGARRGELY
ncbi:MAG: CpsD/CapB family tyrosine-protein kinase, partial [Bryobacteraceae bacterium]